jgi:eukaryotic-like serine/threonine-protein kinase
MSARIASGGMASVYLGRLLGPVGFTRVVAIKRMHKIYSRDPQFVAMFLDEARIAARIRHPNVVQTLDVVAEEGELFLVMDYVEGESLATLWRETIRSGATLPARVAVGIACGALHGLHAAHEAKGEAGEPLGVVHRDVSPQNLLVGVDGVPRVLDFGIARAVGRMERTQPGQLKGKVPYMAPEQIKIRPVTRRTDVYGAAVVLWELLAGRRLYQGEEFAIVDQVLAGKVPPPSSLRRGGGEVTALSRELDQVVLRGLSLDPEERFATAREMALALERCTALASASEIGEWVTSTAGNILRDRAAQVSALESASAVAVAGDTSDEPRTSVRPPAASQPVGADEAPARGQLEAPRTAATAAKARLVGIAGGVCGLTLAVALAAGAGSPPAPPLAAAGARDISRRAGAAVSPPSPPTAEAPAPTTTTASDPAASAGSAPRPAPRPPRPSGAAPSAQPQGARSAVPADDHCKVPYVIDAEGVKTFKPGCVR